MGKWQIPVFIQGWGTKGESKISSFFSDVNQRNEGAGSFQDFLTWLQGLSLDLMQAVKDMVGCRSF